MSKLVFSLYFFSSFLFATSDTYPLMTKERSREYLSLEYQGWAEKITVYSDGNIVKGSRQNSESSWQYVSVARLQKNIMDNLAKQIEVLPRGELLFDPDTPGCADAPTTRYEIMRKNGEIVTFAEENNCQFAIIEDSYFAQLFAKILDGLECLAAMENEGLGF